MTHFRNKQIPAPTFWLGKSSGMNQGQKNGFSAHTCLGIAEKKRKKKKKEKKNLRALEVLFSLQLITTHFNEMKLNKHLNSKFKTCMKSSRNYEASYRPAWFTEWDPISKKKKKKGKRKKTFLEIHEQIFNFLKQ